MPRLLENHRTASAAAVRRFWTALVAEFGEPAHGSLKAIEMGRAAMALLRADEATRAWIDAQHQRDTGKGKRPTAAAVARLQKRVALEEASATALLDRLRALAGPRPRLSPIEEMQKLAEEGYFDDK